MGPPPDRGRGGVFVGLGGNLGDPIARFREAVARIDGHGGTRVLRQSSFYRAPAWGPVEQPDFVNAVIEIDTALPPPELVDVLLSIERDLGRTRGEDRWGPRLLDLDLLVYRDERIDVPGCHVPHPRLRERAFALVPLAELAAGLCIPGLGGVRELLAGLPAVERARVARL
jgi:2-amino-4-hydroxy-6-hydroxymethyldihydropteridine diphosphokinase